MRAWSVLVALLVFVSSGCIGEDDVDEELEEEFYNFLLFETEVKHFPLFNELRIEGDTAYVDAWVRIEGDALTKVRTGEMQTNIWAAVIKTVILELRPEVNHLEMTVENEWGSLTLSWSRTDTAGLEDVNKVQSSGSELTSSDTVPYKEQPNEESRIAEPDNKPPKINNLIVEYRFEGNAQDSSGNGNHGRVFEAKFTDGVDGQALEFDGVDDYVDVGTLSVASGNITLEIWIKPSRDLRIGKSWGIIDTFPWTAGSARLWGRESIEVNTPGVAGEPTSYWEFNSDWTGQWKHVTKTFSWDGSNSFNVLYIDGEPVKTAISPRRALIEYVYIGVVNRPQGDFFPGTIDEVRIYNRVLSAEEIKTNYESLMD